MEVMKGQPDVSILLLLQARMGGMRGVDRRKEKRDVHFLVTASGDGNLEKEVVVDGNGKKKVQQQAGVVGNVQQ